jgi:molybdenum cofactor cytidylyltransferase
MNPRPTIVVLAAGSGSRFEGAFQKLEQALGAASVLGHTIARAIETQLPVVVVTTASLVALVSLQLATRDIVVVPDAEAQRGGIGHSIAVGVAERAASPGWVVLPGDMPLVQPATLLAVAAAIEQHPVVCAQYRGRRGHPIGFAAELYSELVAMTGDDAVRRVFGRYPVHGREVDDPGVLVDIDTVADLDAARAVAVPQRADGPIRA